MYRIIFQIVLVSVLTQSYAQQKVCNTILKGKVLDAVSGNPIEGVQVIIAEQQKGDYTDSLGTYSISGLCQGNYQLVCRHLNHDEQKESITLSLQELSKTIYMSCHTDSLHQVVVKGAKLHWEDVTVVNKVQGKDLFQQSGLSLGKALERVNGVYNLSTGNHINKPVIRGLHSNRVLILNNGIRQEGQQWGNEHAPEIDQYMAKSIEVVKGAQTIRYGSDIIGGLILVNPASMLGLQGIGGEYNLSAFSNGRGIANSLTLQGAVKPLPGLTWRLQGTIKRMGNSKTPDYFLKNTGMKELNYSATIAYQMKKGSLSFFHSYFNTDIGIFAGSHIGNLTDLYTAFQSGRPIDSSGFSYTISFPYQKVIHQLNKWNFEYRLNPFWTLKATYGLQINTRKEFDKNLILKQDDGSYAPTLHFDLQTHNVDVAFEHASLRKWVGAIGMNGFYQENRYYGNYFIPNYRKIHGGVFATEKWHRRAFSFEAGLRYDINRFKIYKWENNTLISPLHQFHGMAATSAFRYQWPHVTMHLNLGTAWRAPFVNELYSFGVHHSAASFEMGDRTIGRERSFNSAITVDFNYKNKVDAELTLYNNYIEDYINLQPVLPATLTIRGAFPTFLYSQTNAVFRGIEFSASVLPTPLWVLHTKANLVAAKDLQNNKFMVGIPPARLELDAERKLLRKEGKVLNISAGATYTLRQFRIEEGADYVPAPPAYFLLHTDLHAEWNVLKRTILFNLGIQNMLNARYRDYLNRNRYFANETGRNVSLRLSFPLNINHSSIN